MELPPDHVGIGDDCAVIPKGDGKSWLLSTDCLQEDIHFLRSKISAEDLGYKSLMVNLSDIAAMGGTALYCLLTLSLPNDIDVEWVDAFSRGFQGAAQAHGVLLMGGDTTRASSEISIGVTVVGEAKRYLLRSGVQEGDVICVTGPLGDSGAGLHCLQHDIDNPSLINAHCRPEAQLTAGQWLAEQEGVHAMIDLSDGLYSDLKRLKEASGWGFDIELSKLPLSESLRNSKLNALDFALFGGEDYQLLASIAANHFDDISQHFNGDLHPIGTATKGPISYYSGGQPQMISDQGFKHFS